MATIMTKAARSHAKNTSKACEECRRRKQRCSGESPCITCQRRGATCWYRVVTRTRNSRQVTSEDADLEHGTLNSRSHATTSGISIEQQASGLNEIGMEQIQSTLPRRHIFNSIRVTDVSRDSSLCISELLYGPLSSFSLLRHLHAHLELPSIRDSSPLVCPGQFYDDNESLDAFNYRERAFRSIPSAQDADVAFLQYDLAKGFQDVYLRTVHHLFPLVSAETVQPLLLRLYDPNPSNVVGSSEKALVLATLAIGAGYKHDGWRKILFEKALKESEKSLYDINMEVVQTELLLAHCEFIWGSPQVAYLILGRSLQKSLAAGLHRLDPSYRQPHHKSAEATRTFWSVYCYETLVSLTFGWPILLQISDMDFSIPEHGTFTWALFRMCEVMQEIHKLYRCCHTTINADLKTAYKIFHDLQSLRRILESDLEIFIGKPLEHNSSENLVQHVVLSYEYFNIVCLTFRPFLLLSLEFRRQTDSESLTPTQSLMLTIDSTLQDACDRCIDAARSIIVLADTVISLHPVAEILCNHELFLETACFILALATLHDLSSYDTHDRYYRRAMSCLGQMSPRERLTDLIDALEQLHSKVGSFINRAANDISVLPTEAVPSQELPTATDGVYPQIDEAALSLDGVEQTLQSLEQLPDAEWPFMNWNLSGIDLGFLDSLAGDGANGGAT
ncbi:hypothetical protein P152DRAFT_454207 [Eremomyces bilateralis CBS 781.70]|uniref:Zn(2)-C6 fungal-type domain-containing protein n=1 Tax=Eremomyces bilateralis CBS 781.70 TaxID=1392243 RepID=A0A6G1GHR2_9PEZI|nr:uncharacterized protein P152DRAFT_454207 [Eremomyces bilateralis CBS 781.70]KAF1817635.1 hypothetical protein P152DRAFT_454207 [Eremomyces bilateralis CBS 781.70]